MNNAYFKIASTIALCGMFLGAGVASAQTITDPAAAAAAMQTAALGTGATTPVAVLGVSFKTAPSVPAGAQQVALALITFDASAAGQNVAIQSIPIAAQYSGLPSAPLTSCSIQNVAALGTPLSALSAGGTLGPTGSVFSFPTPILIPSGSAARYLLVCNVSPLAQAGGSIMLGTNPGSITAIGANGQPITVVATGGSTGPLVGTVTITPAGGSGPGIPNTGGGAPGIPNTGVGGDALATLLILTLSLLAAYAGAVATRRMGIKSL